LDVDTLRQVLAAASQVMHVREYRLLEHPPGAVQLRGKLLETAEEAHRLLSDMLVPVGYVPTLHRDGAEVVLSVLPARQVSRPSRPWLAAALLGATVLSVLFVGSTMVHQDLAQAARDPLSGLPFALSLLGILGSHEMSHYFVARRYRVAVSLPYFIPLPFGLFGTLGAVISMQSPPANRRQLLRIGMAGPLGGLVVALGVVLYGLATSPVTVIKPGTSYIREGNSILYLLLKYAVFGRILPDGPVDVELSPVAFAGWAGLFVTGLNLIPAGQLDGGHIAFALLGRRARALTLAISLSLLVLGAVLWQGWLLWGVLLLLLASRPQVVLDSVTELRPAEKAMAVGMLVLFVLLFTPVPIEAFL
jgi:membrane-associated protease RseP (regulator of RpoE activity)